MFSLQKESDKIHSKPKYLKYCNYDYVGNAGHLCFQKTWT